MKLSLCDLCKGEPLLMHHACQAKYDHENLIPAGGILLICRPCLYETFIIGLHITEDLISNTSEINFGKETDLADDSNYIVSEKNDKKRWR